MKTARTNFIEDIASFALNYKCEHTTHNKKIIHPVAYYYTVHKFVIDTQAFVHVSGATHRCTSVTITVTDGTIHVQYNNLHYSDHIAFDIADCKTFVDTNKLTFTNFKRTVTIRPL